MILSKMKANYEILTLYRNVRRNHHMRNKIISLMLAMALAMSLFAVSTSATSFTDDNDIVNKDAVAKLSALHIMNGRDNGKFDPKGIVTRAELCKMICIALNGGNDPKLNGNGVDTLSFTDTKDHWAMGYIEYEVNMGIVAGMGDKTFAPDQGVTALQACKMLLVALGYNAKYEKLTGDTWELITTRLAMQKNLFDELEGIDPREPLTRDNAAQIVWNFCKASLVKYEYVVGTGPDSELTQAIQSKDTDGTVLSKYYKLKSVTETLNKITYDHSKKEYGYQIGETTYYSTEDYSYLFGMKVELLYKDMKRNDEYDRTDDVVYGINPDSKLMAEGYVGDFSKSGYSAERKELSFQDKTYPMDAATVPSLYFVDGTTGTPYAGNASALVPTGYDCAKIRLLDADNNNKIDKIVIVPFNLEEVTNLGSDNVTLTGTTANKQLSDVTAYKSMAKNDQVCVFDAKYSITGKLSLQKATVLVDVISEVKNNEYKLGDSWYVNRSGVYIKQNDKINYVAFGGEIFFAKVVK
jgi:hypothetical protein